MSTSPHPFLRVVVDNARDEAKRAAPAAEPARPEALTEEMVTRWNGTTVLVDPEDWPPRGP